MKIWKRPLELSNLMFCKSTDRDSILAAISTRDISKDMVRVKSSNVWSYGINIKEYGDKVGDVYAQFKGANGGPDGLYVFYDVPVSVWRKWLSIFRPYLIQNANKLFIRFHREAVAILTTASAFEFGSLEIFDFIPKCAAFRGCAFHLFSRHTIANSVFQRFFCFRIVGIIIS